MLVLCLTVLRATDWKTVLDSRRQPGAAEGDLQYRLWNSISLYQWAIRLQLSLNGLG